MQFTALLSKKKPKLATSISLIFILILTDSAPKVAPMMLPKKLIKLKQDNIQGLVIDLQDNGGGSMEEAIKLAGMFIDYGPVSVLVNNKSKHTILKDYNRGSRLFWSNCYFNQRKFCIGKRVFCSRNAGLQSRNHRWKQIIRAKLRCNLFFLWTEISRIL